MLTRDELTARLLALVLAAVLAWYTFVAVPVYAQTSTRGTPDDGGSDGEVRPVRPGAESEGVVDDSADELDWPEYICLD